ncbi:glycosyltransferase family 4 protein [Flavobacterium ginsenosidimutans]|uniref:glycosyltransferase family 4 protein n=1 Tax=Flavobacterium ginsenosidimutans TaxID=687844 RepID=UPI000DAE7C4D|nr:glycosyltransferase family 4 protein [Flavobacterium ginsenosidimutans]KAF2334162.1 glycosyltransferase family 4 protein [Flavobacterium ginsenosidimutans]
MQAHKIAFYIGDFTRSGGTERACTSIVNSLASQTSNKVYLIVTNSIEEKPFFSINSDVTILYLNSKYSLGKYLTLIYRLNNVIKSNNIEVVVAVEVFSLLFILPIILIGKLTRKKTKLIVWEHFNFTVDLGKNLRRKFRWLAGRFADAIIVLTKRDVVLWKSNLKINGKILAINNPSSFAVSKKEYNKESINIVAIGRLTYQKGFDRLIEIWYEFLEKYSNGKNWKLQIIGSGEDKEMLDNLIVKYNLNNVEMVSNTSSISDYYENASFLAMTSRFEGLPMTLIEAQSFGLPIIAYDCLTGPSEVITQKSGFLIEDNNKEEFVEKLQFLISNDALRSEMSEVAKEEMKRFSEIEITQQWKELIETF